MRRILTAGDLKLDKAKKEVKDKGDEQIDRESAETWAARALASYDMCATERSLRARVERFSEADDYRHEALEHAGTSGDFEALARIARKTEKARTKALKTFEEDE